MRAVFTHHPGDGAAPTALTQQRLWRTFMGARVGIAAALAVLQAVLIWQAPMVSGWSLVLCLLHLALCLVTFWWSDAPGPQGLGTRQWLFTMGIDVAVFAGLQVAQANSAQVYAPLFALPVLMAATVGPLRLGLGTAALATLFLLGEAFWQNMLGAGVSAPRLFQAALTSLGFLVLAMLVHQLAQRLAREQQLALRSQTAARIQQQVNELVMQDMSEGVLVMDPLGQVRSLNRVAQALMDAADRAPLGITALPAAPGWQAIARLVETTFRQGQAQAGMCDLGKPGEASHLIAVRTRLTPSQGSGRAGLCVVFLADQRETEARIRTEKLASMGRMSAAVAHEIRNPLSAIAHANALLEEEVSAPEQKRLTRMIDQNAQRLARTVDDVLNVARVSVRDPAEPGSTVALDTVVDEVLREWQDPSPGAPLERHAHAAGVVVQFNPEHLRRVLVNLLDNARKHARPSGQAVHVASQREDANRVRLSVWSPGQLIDEGVRRHLFEPFFSSESRSSGLGLYLCRELCERHGATIGYQRRRIGQDEGNEFYVLMSLAPPPLPDVVV